MENRTLAIEIVDETNPKKPIGIVRLNNQRNEISIQKSKYFSDEDIGKALILVSVFCIHASKEFLSEKTSKH